MEHLVIPANYRSELNLYETQEAISTIKDFFQQALSEQLTLLRVTAPLFVTPESGLNDNLNGIERPVDFDINFEGQGTAIYKFEVKNSGDVDAVLRNINYGNPKCTPFNNDVESCHNVSYKLTYSDGREVLTGDVINSGTHMDMQLVIEFGGSNDSGIMLNELDFILLYEQA